MCHTDRLRTGEGLPERTTTVRRRIGDGLVIASIPATGGKKEARDTRLVKHLLNVLEGNHVKR